MAQVLMVVSGADRIVLADGTEHPTGFWAEELVALHRCLTEAGHELEIATPGGRRPTVDPASLDLQTAEGQEFAEYLASIYRDLGHPRVLSELWDRPYDAIVLPGGHGPMVDLAFDADLGRILVEAANRDAVIGILCHGPAGLLSAIEPDGRFAFAGRRLTVFTDVEERLGGVGENAPYLVEDRLRELGAVVTAGDPWSSTVVVDGSLVSGQNPQSSLDTAARLVTALAGL